MTTLRSITFIAALVSAPALFAQCTIDIGNDTTVCAGEPVTVTAPGGFASYLWSDGSTGQSITTTNPGIVWCEVSYTTPNLVFNGDFSLGNVGFTTDYTLNNPIWNDPEYNIASDASTVHPFFQGFDHTGGGNFFVGNGGTNSQGLNVWCQTINNICPNTNYVVSGWMSSVEPNHPADFQFVMNGNGTGNIHSPPSGPGVWAPMSDPWNSGTSTTLDLCITNGNGWGVGNDFGLDDLSVVGNVVIRDTMVITHLPLPVVDIGPDTTLCAGAFLTLDAWRPNASYIWQDFSTNATLNVFAPGIYWVIVTENGCSNSDAIVVNYNALPTVDLGQDTTLCVGQDILLDATLPGATYSWQDASSGPDLLVNTSGTYWVDVTLNNCTVRDSIDVSYQAYPMVDLGPDTALCDGDVLTLDASFPGAMYLWQDASTNSTYNVSSSGIYAVDVSIGYCTVSDAINVTYNPIPSVDLGPDTTLCTGELLLLDATLAGATYEWQDGSNMAAFNVNTAGTYWVEVDLNNCSSRDTLVVSYQNYPVVDLGPDTSLCAGELLTLDAFSTGATYLWQDASTNSTFNVSTAGIYSVDVSIGNCTSSDAINVIYNPIPSVDLGPDTALCQGETLLLDATLAGASYAWQDGSVQSTFTLNTAGIYWVDVTLNNCTARDSIEVFITPMPLVDLGNDTTICAGTSVTLNATLAGASYLWSNNSNGPTLNTSTAGSYWVDVTLNNCTSSDTINIGIQALPIVNLGNDTSLCPGDQLILDATVPGATYAWSDATNGATLTADPGNTYWVDVTLNNCTTSDTIIIGTEPLPQVDLGNDTTLCAGATLQLDATWPGATYEWDNASSLASRTISTSGTYWVEVSLNNCSASDTIEVNYISPQGINLGADTAICQGASLLLDASTPGGTYLWQDNSTSSTLSLNSAGTYWVEVTSNNCSAADTINVTITQLPVVALGNDTLVCPGEFVLFDAGMPGASYLWSNNAVSSSISVNVPGIYWVDVTSNFCSASDTVQLSNFSLPVVDIGNDTTLCPGETLLLDALTPGGNYEWQNGSLNSTFSVNSAGIFWVDVSVNGCTVRDSIEVDYLNAVALDIGNDTTLCDGETILLDATTSGANYTWQDGSTQSTLNVTSAGVYWVDVGVSGCIVRDSIEVQYQVLPVVDLGPDSTICVGSTLLLDATQNGVTYLWQDASILPTYSVSSAGTYWVELTLNGCTNADSIDVTIRSLPVVDLGSDTTLCIGEQLMMDASLPGATYEWQDGSNNATYSASTAGAYWVEVFDGICSNSDSVDVGFIDPGTFSLGNDTSICPGEQVTFDATTIGANYLWNDGSTLATFTTASAGNYWVTISISGCTASDTVQVDMAPLPIVDLGPDTTLCSGTSYTLSVEQVGASYLWQDGSTASDLVVSTAGNYNVEVTLGLCLATDAIEIYSMDPPTVDLPSFESICEGEYVELNASYPGASYLWSNGSTDPIYPAGTAGVHTVIVSNECGDAQASTLIEMEDCACTVYVPNAFTPDGNGVNEGFAPVMECDLLEFNFRVFDRWGEELFFTEDRTQFWNGEYGGQPVADGVYVWVLEYKGLSSSGIESDRKMGHVTVLR